jgi:hypothetical protein
VLSRAVGNRLLAEDADDLLAAVGFVWLNFSSPAAGNGGGRR